jgi:UDP-2,3-diacylglucosamine pyrophosphatase LpxH
MATVKKGILTRAGEWRVHLRPYGKREFWKGERKAAVRDVADRVDEVAALEAIEEEVEYLISGHYHPEHVPKKTD